MSELEHHSGSSTPSRKRSRWDAEDDEAGQSSGPVSGPTLHKRRTKAKTSSKADDPQTQSSTLTAIPSQSVSSNERTQVPHSVYVPPRTAHPPIMPSRSVYCYERLNSIEEGSYGVVFRARDKETGDIVALKKLKLDEEKNGFPITALREINALMVCKHENVVGIREVVVGDTLTQYVMMIVQLF